MVLGGAKTLVDSLVLRWMKDAASYKDFNVYMTSDLHFLMQILEDDMCYVNVSGLYKGLLKNSEEEGKYDR